jgi:uncharacterized protein (TIGR02186 family)
VVRRALVLACLGGLALTPHGAAAARPGDGALRVEPARARIGVFYDGVRLTISADVDSGMAVAFLVSGPAGTIALRTQARVWGTFWAPSGHVTFEHIPAVYLLRTSDSLQDVASATVLRPLGLGYDSFRPDPAQRTASAFFPELIRLKESERLFRILAGGVGMEPAPDGGRRVTAAIALPARAPAATYRVQLFGFRDGRLVLRSEGAFELSHGTFNALVGSLAREHGLAYGIVAVVVAVGAGLLVGLVFGSIKGH